MEQVPSADSKPGKSVFAKLRARATSFGSADSQGKRSGTPPFVARAGDKEGTGNVNANIPNGPNNTREFRTSGLVDSSLKPPAPAFFTPEIGETGYEEAQGRHVPRSPTPILADTFGLLEFRYLQYSDVQADEVTSAAAAASVKPLKSGIEDSGMESGTSGITLPTSSCNFPTMQPDDSLSQLSQTLFPQPQPERASSTSNRLAIIGTIARPAYPMPRKRDILLGEHSSSSGNPVRTPLCDFKLFDELPRKSRIALASLQRLDAKLRREGRLKISTKEFLRGKKDKDRESNAGLADSLEMDAKDMKENRRPTMPTSPGSALDRLGAFLKSKKGKKKTRNVVFHLLNLAIHDDRPEHACALLAMISSNTLRKKKPQEANRTFLLAMAKKMENVALIMFEKGFPMDVNAPIFGSGHVGGDVRIPQANNGPAQNANTSIPFAFPSFFILAVGLGLDSLVRVMIKRANLNQTWFGLTPLILATTRQGIGSPLMVSILLEHGADPGQGICLEQLYALIRIKHGTGTTTGSGDTQGGSESRRDKDCLVSESLQRKMSMRHNSAHSGPAPVQSAESQEGGSEAMFAPMDEPNNQSVPIMNAEESAPSYPPVEESPQEQNTTARQLVVPLRKTSLYHQTSSSKLMISTAIKQPAQRSLFSYPVPTDVDSKGYPRQVILAADGMEERKLSNNRCHGRAVLRSNPQKGESIITPYTPNNVTDTSIAQTGVNDLDSSRSDSNSAAQDSASPILGLRRRLSVSMKGKIAKELDGIKIKRLSKSIEVKEEALPGVALEEIVQNRIVLPVEFAAAVGNSRCVFYVLRRYESRRPLVDSQFGLLVQQNLPITAQLLSAGAPVTQRDSRGSTPLHLAARTNTVQIIHALLAMGVDCNIPGENGWTALHEAVSRKSKAAALVLVEHGADLNAKTKDGDTPAIVGSKIGLNAEELQSFFDASKLRTTDQDEERNIHRYIFDIVNATKRLPLSAFTYPPLEGQVVGGRKRCETAPASNQMLSVATSGARSKKKTAMERFGFRPRSSSGGGPASVRSLSSGTMSAQALPIMKEIVTNVHLDSMNRSTSAPLTATPSAQMITSFSESRSSVIEPTTTPSDVASSVNDSDDQGRNQKFDHDRDSVPDPML